MTAGWAHGPRRDRESGFSLVEVILALALLGSVLISVTGLFLLGTRQVHSGRNQSVAMSAAREILEEFNAWSYHWSYEAFGFDGAATTYTVDSSAPGYATKWQARLERELGPSRAEIVIQSINGTVSPPNLVDGRAMRIVVTVFWQEGPRPRSTNLAMVRM